jgi:hypothetical protein
MVLSIYPKPIIVPPVELSRGNVVGVSQDQKFGRNDAVGTTFEPITAGGIYRTPRVSGATALRIKAGGNANDTAAGTGARKVVLIGLDETGALTSEELTLAGASASAPSTTTFLRLFESYVSESGTYATATAGSHAADIVIEDAAGTEDWATIQVLGIPRAQSQIGVISVPLGKEMYITDSVISVDSTKVLDVIAFQRRNILETAAPYTAMRSVEEHVGVIDYLPKLHQYPLGPFPALTDFGYMARVSSGTADATITFNYLFVNV